MKSLKKRLFPVFLLFLFASSLHVIYHEKRPYLTVIGRVKMADGIGRQTAELIHTFYQDFSLGFIPTGHIYLTDVPEVILPIVSKPNRNLGSIVVYESPLPDPDSRAEARLSRFFREKKKPQQIRIAYSMIESSKLPSKWVELLNDYFDAVAVPDLFLVDVYQSSGVSIPIFVLPLGLEIEAFLEAPLKSSKNTPFCFINTSSMIPRKNPLGLIEAFYKAFGSDSNVQLHINYRSFLPETEQQVKNLIASLHLDNIFLTNQKLTNKEYLDFFRKGDAFISLTKGEGFSIQPREAMALGLPVIISDNTAHHTILATGLACGVDCPKKEASYNPYLECVCGEQSVPDVDQAVLALKNLYENYDEVLKQSDQRREWARSYRFENLKPLYLNLIKPTKIELGKENKITTEGLITTSVDLYEKYQKLMK